MGKKNAEKAIKVVEALERFVEFVKNQGDEADKGDPASGFKLMFAFYETRRAKGCDMAHGGDMLLFQWGTYDWGKGKRFELDVTRQLIVGDGEDDEIFQLSLTYLFKPTAKLIAIKSGNRWCRNLSELAEFKKYVVASAAFKAVGLRTDGKSELDFEIAG